MRVCSFVVMFVCLFVGSFKMKLGRKVVEEEEKKNVN